MLLELSVNRCAGLSRLQGLGISFFKSKRYTVFAQAFFEKACDHAVVLF
jgi:hypothetical protein